MKINAARVRQLREARAWSQEHLATVAELSLRTVQRVEADGTASAETRMALASALGVDLAALALPVTAPTENAAPPVATPPGPAEGPPPPRMSWRQYRTLRFLVIVTLIVGLDIANSGTITWSKWVLLFGGAIFLLRAIRRTWVEPRPTSGR